MNPYTPPTTPAPILSVSLVAVGILTIGTIGPGAIAAILCGVSCYLDIDGDWTDDAVPIVILFAVPFISLASLGISGGMVHLRRNTQFSRIPITAYMLALAGLITASLFDNPIARWPLIFVICVIISFVSAIRAAVRYQVANSGGL